MIPNKAVQQLSGPIGGGVSPTRKSPVRSNEVIDEYLTSPKYTKTVSPWKSTAREWGLALGTTHTIYSHTGKLKAPFSVIPAIIKRDNIQDSYHTMFKSLRSMYSRVQTVGMDAGAEIILRKSAYAVAWIPEDKRFYRVRVVEMWEEDRILVSCFDNACRKFVEADQLFPICSKFLTMCPRVVNLYLDGLEHFDHCKDVKRFMEDMAKWKHVIFSYKVTRHKPLTEKGKAVEIYGLLYEQGQTMDLNSAVIRQLWEGIPALNLPEESLGVPDWTVTHALDDGTIFVTLDGPVAQAFRDYQMKVKLVLEGLIKDSEPDALKNFKPVSLEQSEIYLTVYDDCTEFYRVKLLSKISRPSNGAKSDMKFDFVRVRFIDIGKEEDCFVSSLLLAKKLHPYIALVPPLCVKAHLLNVKTLNVTRFIRELAAKKPFILRTVKKRIGNLPAEVQLFMNQEVGSGLRRFVSVGEEAYTIQIAKRPAQLIPEFSAIAPDIVQLENIDMEAGTDWSENPGDDSFLSLERDLRFHFVINAVMSISEFAIHAIGSETKIQSMSDEIKTHVNLPWVKKTMHNEIRQLHRHWFYSYFYKEKNCYTRVRLVEQGPLETVKILLIDFSEYIEIQLKDLLPTIPFSVCQHGPQAARIVNYIHNVPMSKQFTSLETVRKMYLGKKCSALLQDVVYDAHDMTTLKVKRLVRTD